MKTKTIELYEFDELPEDIRKKILERERYINVEDSWWSDCALDEWKEKLTAVGFDDPVINFSGFYSQGDGASFTCKDVDILTFITSQKAKGRFKNLIKAMKTEKAEILASVERISHHYSHEYTVKADVETIQNDDNEEFYNKVYRESLELESLMTETVRSLSKQIYRDLESEYEGLTSDESVIDTIKANEYTFRASAEMEN